MNTVDIRITIEDPKLLNTLSTTIDVEMEATKTERGQASTMVEGNVLIVKIEAADLVATRAITNSVMRLLQASIDVVETIFPQSNLDQV